MYYAQLLAVKEQKLDSAAIYCNRLLDVSQDKQLRATAEDFLSRIRSIQQGQ